MKSFLIGLQFLTRISVVKQTVWTEESFGRSVKYFPAIGAVLGFCYVFVILSLVIVIADNSSPMQFLMTDSKFPMLKAALILMSMAIFTGAIHCDGFMDTMDGLFSGRERERMLEIMKDSRVGAFGVVSFVMLSILEFATLTELARSSTLTTISAIYSAPIIGRLMMVLTIGCFPYARAEGMGKAFSEYTTRSTMIFATFETFILLSPQILLSMEFFKTLSLSILLTLIFTMYFGRMATKKVGGVTGDIYGAVEIISETIVLLSFMTNI